MNKKPYSSQGQTGLHFERVSTVHLDGNGGEGGRLEGDYLDDLFAVIPSIELVSNYD